MKKKTVLQRAAAAMLSLFLCACCLPRANALAPIEDRSCTLSVDLGKDHKYPGVPYQVYRAGDLSDKGQFTLTGGFAEYPVGSLKDLGSSGWLSLAETLAAYAAADKLTPVASAETDADGKVEFTGLSRGLYLVVGKRTAFSMSAGGQEGMFYIEPMPFLVSLPTWQEGDTWLYDLAVTDKSKHTNAGEGEILRRVLKVWNDNNNAANRRPEEITVDLLRDGEVYDTVTLNAENNWRYAWEGLDNSYEWQIVERNVPSDYRVSTVLQGVTFVVTNRYSPPGNPPGNPPPENPPPENPPPENPPPENPPPDVEIPEEPVPEGDLEIPDNPPPLTNIEMPDPEPEDFVEVDEPDVPLARLPQTGVLWWPVPVLAMGGMVLFVLGWVRRRNAGYEG